MAIEYWQTWANLREFVLDKGGALSGLAMKGAFQLLVTKVDDLLAVADTQEKTTVLQNKTLSGLLDQNKNLTERIAKLEEAAKKDGITPN